MRQAHPLDQWHQSVPQDPEHPELPQDPSLPLDLSDHQAYLPHLWYLLDLYHPLDP